MNLLTLFAAIQDQPLVLVTWLAAGMVAVLQAIGITQVWKMTKKVDSVHGTLHGNNNEGGLVEDVRSLRQAKHKTNSELTKLASSVGLLQRDLEHIGGIVERRLSVRRIVDRGGLSSAEGP
jgi:hypothetical protein